MQYLRTSKRSQGVLDPSFVPGSGAPQACVMKLIQKPSTGDIKIPEDGSETIVYHVCAKRRFATVPCFPASKLAI